MNDTALPRLATPAIHSMVDARRERQFRYKRVVDLVLCVPIVVVLLPVMALVALAITLDSRGPVCFVQQRAGLRRRVVGGVTHWEVRPFAFYKFRSMVDGADQSLHEQYVRAFVQGRLHPSATNGTQPKFKLAHDPRVTRVGRILRRTSLDELPQFINVIKGEMSLVGPRPVPLYEIAEYRDADLERLAVPPGITGLWQVNGRGEVPFAEMMRLDREYVRRQSLWLDFTILLTTIPVVLSGRGAK
jgi:lipopolysaccharide/colanic/teichoic acid biosynthesis glycosyltransferase